MGSSMQAVIRTRSGPPEVLQLREVEKPVPRRGEVLVKVHAATVTQGDVVTRRLPGFMLIVMRVLMGMRRKRTPGTELAGVVEALGEGVSRFRAGDPVFGSTGLTSAGSYAEYVCLPEGAVLTAKPSNMNFAEAAAVPVGGVTALYYLRAGNLQRGQRALIYGASGSVGTFAVQLARHFGADVAGVCSTANLELVRSLGADPVIDYTREDFAQRGEVYDLIFDAAGKTSQAACGSALTEDGAFVTVQKGLARGNLQDLNLLKDIIEAGGLRSVIDRRYPLERITEAHRYVETGRKRGNVVITVAANGGADPR